MTVHEPVLLEEVIRLLKLKSNDSCIDGTAGGGGHAEAILKEIGPSGRLLALDWDKEAIARCKTRLKPFGDRVVLVQSNYREIKRIAYEKRFNPVSGILLDLGLSLDQLQISGRGFTFLKDEPLDMRYSVSEELTAADILNTYSVESLVNIFRDYGDEPAAWKIAHAIELTRKHAPFKTTNDLVDCVRLNKRVDPRKTKKTNPATQVFQALRIAVNHEYENIQSVIADIISLLDAGGRCAIITFHSGEDRLLKSLLREEMRTCQCPPEKPFCDCTLKPRIKLITRKAVKPTAAEIERNPRSRSAQLRVFEKI